MKKQRDCCFLFGCAGHGANSVRDKLTTGLYRQV